MTEDKMVGWHHRLDGHEFGAKKDNKTPITPGLSGFDGTLAGQPTPVLLPGESHGQRSLVGCSSWGR